jgi:hypothetical protein
MALRTPRADLHPPVYSRTFTTAGSQFVFADSLEASGSDTLNAPAGFNHLPSSVLVSTAALVAGTTATFVWQDASSTVNTLVLPVPSVVNMPFSIRTIGAASTAGLVVTVSWHPEA